MSDNEKCPNCGFEGARTGESETKELTFGPVMLFSYDKNYLVCPECDHRESIRRFF